MPGIKTNEFGPISGTNQQKPTTFVCPIGPFSIKRIKSLFLAFQDYVMYVTFVFIFGLFTYFISQTQCPMDGARWFFLLHKLYIFFLPKNCTKVYPILVGKGKKHSEI